MFLNFDSFQPWHVTTSWSLDSCTPVMLWRISCPWADNLRQLKSPLPCTVLAANWIILSSFPQVSLTSARQNTAARQKQQKSSTLHCSLPLELALLDSKTAIPMLHNQNACGHFISHASKEKPLVGFGTGNFADFMYTRGISTRTSHLLKLIGLCSDWANEKSMVA